MTCSIQASAATSARIRDSLLVPPPPFRNHRWRAKRREGEPALTASSSLLSRIVKTRRFRGDSGVLKPLLPAGHTRLQVLSCGGKLVSDSMRLVDSTVG